METEKGKRVKIRFLCRLQDGRVYQVGDRNTLDFMVGAGSVPPALETGVLGMKRGEHRTIRVPAAEVNLFPFPRGSHFTVEPETPPGIAYEFGPGDGGDVAESIPATRPRHFREPLPAGADLFFEVEMLAVENPGAIN
jgi:hypothetical protein